MAGFPSRFGTGMSPMGGLQPTNPTPTLPPLQTPAGNAAPPVGAPIPLSTGKTPGVVGYGGSSAGRDNFSKYLQKMNTSAPLAMNRGGPVKMREGGMVQQQGFLPPMNLSAARPPLFGGVMHMGPKMGGLGGGGISGALEPLKNYITTQVQQQNNEKIGPFVDGIVQNVEQEFGLQSGGVTNNTTSLAPAYPITQMPSLGLGYGNFPMPALNRFPYGGRGRPNLMSLRGLQDTRITPRGGFDSPFRGRASGYAEGGAVPRQTMIEDQPHMLAYIDPEERSMLEQMGGSGQPGPGGVPAYARRDGPGSENFGSEARDFQDELDRIEEEQNRNDADDRAAAEAALRAATEQRIAAQFPQPDEIEVMNTAGYDKEPTSYPTAGRDSFAGFGGGQLFSNVGGLEQPFDRTNRQMTNLGSPLSDYINNESAEGTFADSGEFNFPATDYDITNRGFVPTNIAQPATRVTEVSPPEEVDFMFGTEDLADQTPTPRDFNRFDFVERGRDLNRANEPFSSLGGLLGEDMSDNIIDEIPYDASFEREPAVSANIEPTLAGLASSGDVKSAGFNMRFADDLLDNIKKKARAAELKRIIAEASMKPRPDESMYGAGMENQLNINRENKLAEFRDNQRKYVDMITGSPTFAFQDENFGRDSDVTDFTVEDANSGVTDFTPDDAPIVFDSINLTDYDSFDGEFDSLVDDYGNRTGFPEKDPVIPATDVPGFLDSAGGDLQPVGSEGVMPPIALGEFTGDTGIGQDDDEELRDSSVSQFAQPVGPEGITAPKPLGEDSGMGQAMLDRSITPFDAPSMDTLFDPTGERVIDEINNDLFDDEKDFETVPFDLTNTISEAVTGTTLPDENEIKNLGKLFASATGNTKEVIEAIEADTNDKLYYEALDDLDKGNYKEETREELIKRLRDGERNQGWVRDIVSTVSKAHPVLFLADKLMIKLTQKDMKEQADLLDGIGLKDGQTAEAVRIQKGRHKGKYVGVVIKEGNKIVEYKGHKVMPNQFDNKDPLYDYILGEGFKPGPDDDDSPVVDDPCPEGFVLSGGVCVPIQSVGEDEEDVVEEDTTTDDTPDTTETLDEIMARITNPSRTPSDPTETLRPITFANKGGEMKVDPLAGGAIQDSLASATQRFLNSLTG